MEKNIKLKEVIKSEIRKVLNETEIDEMARIAKNLKIADLEKAQAVIAKLKDTKKKWVADMIQKVIDAGEEGIAQVKLAKELGKVDEFGDGRQQAINPDVRSLLVGGVFTFTTAIKQDPVSTPEPEEPIDTPNAIEEPDSPITSVEDDEIEIDDETNTEDNDNVEDEEKDEYYKEEEEEVDDDEKVATQATPVSSLDKLQQKLDKVTADMKNVAKKYKAAKESGNKEEEMSLINQLKSLTTEKNKIQKDIDIKLGDEDDFTY